MRPRPSPSCCTYFYPRPLRGGRRENAVHPAPAGYFYPRPLRGGRPRCGRRWRTSRNFYPRPLRGGRQDRIDVLTEQVEFLSTPSARRATGTKRADAPFQKFLSTPSARRATPTWCASISTSKNFYPRPLRGGRPGCNAGHNLSDVFLSTPSARRATQSKCWQRRGRKISIHALCEEGDN